ncbi:MAG: hypothetical protein RSD49_06535 [Hafnia sp.]
MSMQDVPAQFFNRASVYPVVGFVFRYNPDDPALGVCAVTDGTMPQYRHFEAVAKVGAALQRAIFGQEAEPLGPVYYQEDGYPDPNSREV